MYNKVTLPVLAALLSARCGISKRQCEDFVRELFNLVSESLQAGETVKLTDIGTFRLTTVEKRRSVDVTTGEPIEIPGHRKVTFTPAKDLAEALNAPFESFQPIELPEGIDETQLLDDMEKVIPQEEIQREDPQEEQQEDRGEEQEALQEDVSAEADVRQDETVPKPADVSEDTYELPDDDVPGNGFEDDEEEQLPTAGYESASGPEPDPVQYEAENEAAADREAMAESLLFEEAERAGVPEKEATAWSEKAVAPSTLQTAHLHQNTSGHRYRHGSRRHKFRFGWGFLAGFACCLVACAIGGTIYYLELANRVAETAAIDIPEINITLKEGSKSEEASFGDASYTPERPAASAETAGQANVMPEVNTVPSDPIVRDTISHTRYLTTMAQDHYGNFNLWPYIYEENKSFLGHPDRIRPGTSVVIPPLSKYGVNPKSKSDIEAARKKGVEIYRRYQK